MYSTTDELTQAILDAVTQPLMVIDPDGAVAYVNNTASRVLGHRDHRGLVGRSSHEALHAFHPDGSQYPADQCPIVRVAPSPGPPAGREVFLDRSGRAIHVSWTISVLPRPAHRLLAFTPDAGSHRNGRPTVTSIQRQIASEFRDPGLTPRRLAQTNHVSLRTLQAILALQHLSPAQMIRAQRLQHARQLLSEGSRSTAAAFESGFSDADTFARIFRREYGIPPSAYDGK